MDRTQAIKGRATKCGVSKKWEGTVLYWRFDWGICDEADLILLDDKRVNVALNKNNVVKDQSRWVEPLVAL